MVENLIIPLCITVILIITYVVTFTFVFRNASEKKKLLPVRLVFYMLVILEVAKLFYLIGRDEAFYPNRYPIVFCSMVMFAYPIFCFKPNRFSDAAKGFCVIPSILAFFMFAAIQYRYDMSIIQVHSYIYHGSMIAVAIYLLTSKLYKFEFKKFYGQFLIVSGYIVIASCISLLIGGGISIFGPNDPYLSFLYDSIGFAESICLMIVALFVAYFAVYEIIDLCSKKKRKEKIGEEVLIQDEKTESV